MSSSPDNRKLPRSVGIIGLGTMGFPMAVHIAQALSPGSKLHAHDAVKAPVDELHAKFPDTVIKGASARDVAERSEVVLTMLPEGAHVRSVYLDPETGIIAALSPSCAPTCRLLIDSSTIDRATSIQVKEQLLDASPTTFFYDAPVSGGVLGAVNATIAFFLGCSPSDPNIHPLTTLLRTMSAKVIPCGGPSLGLAAKLSNNYLSGIITLASSEAMDMGMRAGLDARVLASVFAAGTAQNAICDTYNPVPGLCPQAPSSNGYRGGFRVQLMRKDMGLAVEMAREVGARNVLGASGLGVYAAASEALDCRDLDSRVVYRYLGGREDWEQREQARGREGRQP